MQLVQGKSSHVLTLPGLAARLAGFHEILVDIGTGDGRYVLHQARACPTRFVIGIDACQDGLREAARRAPANALYLTANALTLPDELAGLATHVTINFPWGSLLNGLLSREAALLDGVRALARPGARLEVRLNGGALAEAGWTFDDGQAQVRQILRDHGWTVNKAVYLDGAALRALPMTWAKRLAFGRDPRAVYLEAVWPRRACPPPDVPAMLAAGALVNRSHRLPAPARA